MIFISKSWSHCKIFWGRVRIFTTVVLLLEPSKMLLIKLFYKPTFSYIIIVALLKARILWVMHTLAQFFCKSDFCVKILVMFKIFNLNFKLLGVSKQGFKLVSSAFALLFTEISVTHTTEISVKSSAKADETSLKPLTFFLLGKNFS